MAIGLYYHCYAAGEWETPTREFIEAAWESGLAEHGPLHLGLVGAPEQRADAWSFCRRYLDTRLVAEAYEGWEQITLSALRAKPVGDHILYCHTKGAAVVDEWQHAWRRSMYLSLVTEWRDCLPWLETVETVGCHWLPVMAGMPQPFPFFGGNMWWARRSLIERLPEPATTTRYDAEAWIGSAPGVTYHDLRPGWPGWETIRQEARRPREPIRL